jgi:hypothetical protein
MRRRFPLVVLAVLLLLALGLMTFHVEIWFGLVMLV